MVARPGVSASYLQTVAEGAVLRSTADAYLLALGANSADAVGWKRGPKAGPVAHRARAQTKASPQPPPLPPPRLEPTEAQPQRDEAAKREEPSPAEPDFAAEMLAEAHLAETSASAAASGAGLVPASAADPAEAPAQPTAATSARLIADTRDGQDLVDSGEADVDLAAD